MRIAAAAFVPPQVLDPSAAVEEPAPTGLPADEGVAVELSANAVRRADRLQDLDLDEHALDDDEEAQLERLRQQDKDARRQAALTQAASGGLTRPGARHTELGPDGRRYLVEEEVELGPTENLSPERQLELAKRLRTAGDGLALSAARLEQQAERALGEQDDQRAEATPANDVTESAAGRRALKAYRAA